MLNQRIETPTKVEFPSEDLVYFMVFYQNSYQSSNRIYDLISDYLFGFYKASYSLPRIPMFLKPEILSQQTFCTLIMRFSNLLSKYILAEDLNFLLQDPDILYFINLFYFFISIECLPGLLNKITYWFHIKKYICILQQGLLVILCKTYFFSLIMSMDFLYPKIFSLLNKTHVAIKYLLLSLTYFSLFKKDVHTYLFFVKINWKLKEDPFTDLSILSQTKVSAFSNGQ